MKKKILLAAYFSALLCGKLFAQAPGITWKNIYEKYPATEYGSCAEPTSDGGYIVGAVSAAHFWIFKVDGSGTQQWERYLGTGTGITNLYAIKQTSDNGFIAAGSDFITSGTDTVGNHGLRDFFVVKLDNAGNISWRKTFGGTSNEEATTIEQTTDGGYIIAGYSFSSDGDASSVHGYCDYWVVKLDTSGNITWQKSLGGANYDYAKSVVQTQDGGYIVAGYSGSKDGDVSGAHWGGSDDDVWVVKLDASGNISWQKSYGGSKEDQAYSIRQTTDGGYIVAGSTVSNDGNVTGKHGTSHDNQDYWVIKLDGSGTLVWQKCLGGSGSGTGAGSGNDIAYSARQTADGGYIVGGTVSSGTATNDDISGYHGTTGSDYWLVKLDGSGNIVWQKCLGGNGSEDLRTAVPTTDGGYIVAGSSVYSPDGDVASPDYSSSHPWIVKLGGTTVVQTTTTNGPGITAYPNPAESTITFSGLQTGNSIRIIDAVGRTVGSYDAMSSSITISTHGLHSGIYTAMVSGIDRISSARFAVEE